MGSEFRVLGVLCRVSGFGFKFQVSDLEFRVSGFWLGFGCDQCDKEGANPDRVMQELAGEPCQLLPAAWGGDTEMMKVRGSWVAGWLLGGGILVLVWFSEGWM